MSAMERFLQNLIDQRPVKRRSPGIAGFLSKKGVGRTDPSDPRWIVYEADDFTRAALLLSSEGLSPKKPQLASPAPTRRHAGAQGNQLVAIACLNAGSQFPSSVRFFAMAAIDAAAIGHEVILVCQDIRVLQRIRDFTWLADYLRGRSTLVLFRGGAGISGFRVTACDVVLSNSTAPVLAVFDLDAAGLVAAARLDRLERFCIPSWRALEHLLAAGGAAPVLRRHALLESAAHPDISRAWQMLRQYPGGISCNDFPA